jgi:hypothetical protein
VQSPQVAEAQLLKRFSAAPDDPDEHVGAPTSSRRWFAAAQRHLDQGREIIIENPCDLASRLIVTGRSLLQRGYHGNLLEYRTAPSVHT